MVEVIQMFFHPRGSSLFCLLEVLFWLHVTKPFVIDWSSRPIIKKEASQCFDFKVLEPHDAYTTHATEVTEIMVEVIQMFLHPRGSSLFCFLEVLFWLHVTKPFPEMVIDWSSRPIIKKEASQCFDFKVFRRLEAVLEPHDAYTTHMQLR